MESGKWLAIVIALPIIWIGIVSIFSGKAETTRTWKKGDWFIPRDAVYRPGSETYEKTTQHTGLEAVAIGALWLAVGVVILYFAFK